MEGSPNGGPGDRSAFPNPLEEERKQTNSVLLCLQCADGRAARSGCTVKFRPRADAPQPLWCSAADGKVTEL